MQTEGISKSELRGMVWTRLKSGGIKLIIILAIYAIICFVLWPVVKLSSFYQADPSSMRWLFIIFPVLMTAYFLKKTVQWLSTVDAQQARWLATASPAEIRSKIEQPKWSHRKGNAIVLTIFLILASPLIVMALYAVISTRFYKDPLFAILCLISLGVLIPVVLVSNWIASSRKSKINTFIAATGFEYIERPLNADGFDITAKSVIAHGRGMDSYENLFRGRRSGHTFRVIDYYYPVGGKGARDTQTIICINMKGSSLTPFSIIRQDYTLLDHAHEAQKITSDKYAKDVSKNYAVIVDAGRKTELTIPIGILNAFSDHAFASNQPFNLEYFGDRILVYCFRKKLAGDDFLKALDYSITLAKILE